MLRFYFMNIQSDHAKAMNFSSSLRTFIKIPFGLSVSIILISYISHGGWLTLLVQKIFNFDLCSPMSFTGTWKIYLNLNNISPHVLGTYVFMINNFLSPLFVDLDQGHVIRLIKLIHKVKHDGVFFYQYSCSKDSKLTFFWVTQKVLNKFRIKFENNSSNVFYYFITAKICDTCL